MYVDELLNFLFDSEQHLLHESMATWLASSRRFTAFVNTFRDKVRKKLRVTQDAESLRDLLLELETAYLLQREPKLSVLYEPGHPEQGRATDFAVSFTTGVTFTLEVTRIRAEPHNAHIRNEAPGSALALPDRIADSVCGKLGQLQPQQSNVLLIGIDSLNLTQEELRGALLRLQQRAERDDPTFLPRYRMRDRTDFFRHFHRLSEVIVRDLRVPTTQPLVIWVNPQARHPLPGKVRAALHRSIAL